MNQSFPLLPLRGHCRLSAHDRAAVRRARSLGSPRSKRRWKPIRKFSSSPSSIRGEDDPVRDDLYDTGVIATVLQLLKLPDGTVRVLVEGKQRAKLQSLDDDGKAVMATVEPIADAVDDSVDTAALMRSVVDQFESYAKLNKKMPAETAVQLSQIDDSSRLADSVCRQPQHQGRRQAGAARRECARKAARNGVRLHGRRARRAAGRKEDPRPREAPDGKESARILSQRAIEGDPARTRQRQWRGAATISRNCRPRSTA